MREAPKCLEVVNGLDGSKTRFHFPKKFIVYDNENL